MNAPRYLPGLCLLSTLLLTGTATAGNKKEAKALFDSGVAHMEAGRYAQGCPDIAESYRLDPLPGALFTLAECEVKSGRIATAVARYEEYLALYATLPRGKKIKQGNRRRESLAQKAALGPKVPHLTLELPPDAPSGTRVLLDGAELDPAALGAPRAVDPGEHIATTQAPGGPVTEVKVTLNKAERHKISLRVEAVPGAPPPIAPRAVALPSAPAPSQKPSPLPRDTGPSGQRVGVYVAGSVGIAGLLAGGITGGLVFAAKGGVIKNCTDRGDGISVCSKEGYEALDSARIFGLASNIGFGVAIAGLSAATILFFTEPSPSKAAPLRSAPALAAEPRWLSAGVLSAGQGGAILGLQGAW